MVPGETVTKEVIKEVEVPGETVVVEKEVVKTVEVPGETVVVTKEVAGPERVVVKEVQGKKYVTDPSTGKVVVRARVWRDNHDRLESDVGIKLTPITFTTRGMLRQWRSREARDRADWAVDRDVDLI